MYNCEDIFEKTDSYLDGELSELEYAEFQKHLENCEACRNSVEFAEKLNGVMQGMPSVEPPADFLDNLHKKIAAEGKAVRFYKKWQPYGALAACLILAVVIRTNAVKDLNETSSYLKMATPEPTVSETTELAVADMSDVQDNEELPDEALPVPATVETAPAVTAAPVQEEISDDIQPTENMAPVSEPAEPQMENAVPVADVPMMLSLNEENKVAVADEATEQIPVPEAAAAPVVQTDSEEIHVDGSATTAESATATAKVSNSSTSYTTSNKRAGGGGGSSSAAVSGGSISLPASPAPNHMDKEFRAEVEALIESLGIQKNGNEYVVSKAVFEQFKTELAEKNIPFDAICVPDGDNVRFVIEWE